MFSSVAVGKLRQAYKSPAITRLRCMFKTPCVCLCTMAPCTEPGETSRAGRTRRMLSRGWLCSGISGCHPSAQGMQELCNGHLQLLLLAASWPVAGKPSNPTGKHSSPFFSLSPFGDQPALPNPQSAKVFCLRR